VTIGAVLGQAWSLYTRFFARFFLLGLVVFAALNLVYALLVEAISSDSEGAIAALGVLGFAIAVIGTTWLEGAFVYAVQDVRDGSFDATLGDIFTRVSPAVLPLVVAGLLAGLGIAVGHNIISDSRRTPSWAGMSFEVPWLTFGVVFFVVYAVALATTLVPAIRASRVYPAEALHYQ